MSTTRSGAAEAALGLIAELRALGLAGFQMNPHPELGFMTPCRMTASVVEALGAGADKARFAVRLEFEGVAEAKYSEAFAGLDGAEWYECAGLGGVEYHIRRLCGEGGLLITRVAEYAPEEVPTSHEAVKAVKTWLREHARDTYIQPFLPVEIRLEASAPKVRKFSRRPGV